MYLYVCTVSGDIIERYYQEDLVKANKLRQELMSERRIVVYSTLEKVMLATKWNFSNTLTVILENELFSSSLIWGTNIIYFYVIKK